MRTVFRLLPAAGACGLAAAVLAGLGGGHGSLVSIRPAAAVSAPGAETAEQATAGQPRAVPLPPPATPAASPAGARGPASSLLHLTSADGVEGIPAVALAAYERAATILAGSDPACGLRWEDLAGIGRVESDNGLTWGSLARVSRGGTLTPAILGPVLDGSGGMPAIPTPDHGVLEQDPVWERAVGPMQFLPSTWAAYAEDADGDGVANPENYYDAALTAGSYLCANGDLGTPSGLRDAIYAYNHSASYVALVEAWISYYAGTGPQALLAAGAGLLPTGVAAAVANAGVVPTAGASAKHRTPAGRHSSSAHRSTAAPAKRRAPARSTTTTTTSSTTTTSTTTTTTLVPPVTIPPPVTTLLSLLP